MNGVDVRIIRIFNTYGPRMNPNDGRVVSNFIVQALKGKTSPFTEQANRPGVFQYVDDLVERNGAHDGYGRFSGRSTWVIQRNSPCWNWRKSH